ncbi:2-C-methyl-D-erythritol 4-phosphate cytidylyltransferase [Prevotella sp. S7-1-8]|uniref:2-C-methyl-D-erythritol 4-phosphate cytidylyltransferase n=1 Tax=Prevotella sp. S7-1-8 TaxID=1284775 RepID=UPI00050F1A9C|nr:2-C-methyl-D-erythritol 4-phosphate cytidylyltransferase [Prevotella sp. S7-1-8]KGF18692.1 2-C-methyl-D-erythritol 4-phosphate cytidylyltransferase [Prevotella sp. S7-1-8]
MDYAIIVAGGKGLRMGTELPKQFLPLRGKPVLMHTIERFNAYSDAIGIIVALPQEQQDFWLHLCQKHAFKIPHTVVNGGATRFDSSKNGLAAVPDGTNGVVAFHDGARPFVSTAVIERCFAAARKHQAAIPVTPVTDSLRHVENGQSHNVRRDLFRAVQTPQVFDIALAKRAFNQPYSQSFTDDASVIESLGHAIAMVEGERENIKLTTPLDLKLAELLTTDL